MAVEKKIQFRILSEKEAQQSVNAAREAAAENEEHWCTPFSVDDVEDFQTQTKPKGVEDDCSSGLRQTFGVAG